MEEPVWECPRCGKSYRADGELARVEGADYCAACADDVNDPGWLERVAAEARAEADAPPDR